MTHQCSFKCLLPWKQAAGIQVWYSDNGLSLSHRALYVTFGLPPPCCSTPLSGFHSIFPFFLFPALIFIYSHHSNTPPPPFPAFHSVQRFYLSLILFTSTLSRCLTSLASLLPSPTCLSHHLPHLFLFIHLGLLVLHHLWFPLSPSPLFGHVFFPLL